MGFYKVFADPRVNWMYESEPEPQLDNRTLYQPRGKVLGGTSSINGMVYMRGNAADYDEWRQRGCDGWDYDSVLPYFKKAENQQRGANEFHGVGGPLRVSDQPRRYELADRLVDAAIQAGLPPNDDFNGARQEGAGYFQSTTGKSRRWSTATAYLRPARNRANLVVRPNAHATRIVIENGSATGVTYRQQRRRTHTARARAEVIVCGGVFNSPQLLQLSGIGPGELLQEHGHRGGPRPAGGGQASAGPFLRPPGVSLHQADHDERAGQQPAAPGDRDGAIRAVQVRPAGRQRRHRRRLRAQRSAAGTARPAVQLHPLELRLARSAPARWRIRFPASA